MDKQANLDESKFKIGDLVRISDTQYYLYYGFANCTLKIIDKKLTESSSLIIDNKIAYKLETLNKKSIEGEEYNPFWVLEEKLKLDFK